MLWNLADVTGPIVAFLEMVSDVIGMAESAEHDVQASELTAYNLPKGVRNSERRPVAGPRADVGRHERGIHQSGDREAEQSLDRLHGVAAGDGDTSAAARWSSKLSKIP